MAPTDAAAWREVQNGFSDRLVPLLEKMRSRLGVSLTRTSLGPVGAFMLQPAALPRPHEGQLVVFFHGGGYVLGGGEAGTGEATLLAAFGGYRVLSVDYRLAPDNPHPAALDDAIAAWTEVVEANDPASLAVGGLSAGGGLALALMMAARDKGLPLPAALSLGSPWSDMSRTGDSYETNEWLDNVLVSYDGYLGRAAALYADGRALNDPRLSPIYGNFIGLPPTILSVGSRDLFLSNTVRTQRALRSAGVVAELQLYEGLSHAQFALNPDARVTKTACVEVADFFDRHLATGGA